MKSVFILTALLFSGSYGFSQPGEGYNERLRQSRQVEMVDWNSEGVYVNSPSDLPAGRWQCQKVSTYQGGPRGSWRTFYVCRNAGN